MQTKEEAYVFAMKPRTAYLFRVLLSAAVMLQAFTPGGARSASGASATQASRSTADETATSASSTHDAHGLMGHAVPFKFGRMALQDIGMMA